MFDAFRRESLPEQFKTAFYGSVRCAAAGVGFEGDGGEVAFAEFPEKGSRVERCSERKARELGYDGADERYFMDVYTRNSQNEDE